jgi:hypothetical protein
MSSELEDLKARFERLVENLHSAYGLSYAEILALSAGPVEKERVLVPLETLRSRELGILESLTLYLRDTRGMRFSEIARALERDPRTIWATYHKAKGKLHGKRQH